MSLRRSSSDRRGRPQDGLRYLQRSAGGAWWSAMPSRAPNTPKTAPEAPTLTTWLFASTLPRLAATALMR